jgi:site-specific recombinase XerC
MAHKFGSLLHQARQAIGKLYGRSHSDKSVKALQSSLRTITEHLKTTYGLQQIENIKPAMVQSFFQARLAAGISPSQLGKDATVYRLLAEKIGKQNIVPRSNAELGFSRGKVDRMQPKTLDKDAADGIRAKLVERSERSGLPEDKALVAAFDLRSAFGLRAGESLFAQVKGNNVEVVGKGGRFRSLPAATPEQKAALTQLRSVSKEIGNVNGKLIPPNHSLKQMYDYQRNTIRSCNGTKSANANMHVMRHDYAQREKAAGTTDKQLSEQLGHGREDVVGHYVR